MRYPDEDLLALTLPSASLKPSEISCWHSHFEVLRLIADGDDDVALIFEDDVDMEFDLERRLRNLWQFLPQDEWDTVALGESTVYLHLTRSAADHTC